MKKYTLIGFLSSIILVSCSTSTTKERETVSTSDSKNTQVSTNEFNFTVEADPTFSGLPGLQSFVFGSNETNWLMFAGRVNGFHGFPNDTNSNFPRTQANSTIFVYDVAAKKAYSMPIPNYGGDTGNVFLCSNLAHTQQDGVLYACGGYGVASSSDKNSKKTYSYFMRMDVNKAIAAVKTNSSSDFKNAIWWGKSDLVKSTGGELFLLPDSNFYLALGHNFEGRYNDNNAKQTYLNQINVFRLEGKGLGSPNKLALLPVGTITDGLPNTTTQFHRRDLVVSPCVQSNGTDIGLSVYGGVFTYAPGPSPSNSGGNPFPHPIYINYLQKPAFRVDSFYQYSNIYSTAFMTHYDPSSQRMMTTLFGGLGDTKANFTSANWSTVISTNIRSYANNGDVTNSLQNIDTLPAYIGAEGVFIPSAGLPYYNKNYNIIDYSKLSNTQTVGYIYGGIVSNQCCSDSSGSTKSSNIVYKVTLSKTLSSK
jgi:hypothetical protein